MAINTTDSDEIAVFANGAVYRAPIGTALPTTAAASLNSEFTHLGYISEEGVTFSPSMDVEMIRAWQSFYPVKRFVTGRDATMSFELLQLNGENLSLAFGGGTFATVSSGQFSYTPPDPDDIDEFILLVQGVAGTDTWRIIFRRAMVTELSEITFARTDAARLPITVGVIADDNTSTQPWLMLTDADPLLAYNS